MMIIIFNKEWNFAKVGLSPVLVNLPHTEKRDPHCHNGTTFENILQG